MTGINMKTYISCELFLHLNVTWYCHTTDQILVKSDIMIGTALRHLLGPCPVHTALW